MAWLMMMDIQKYKSDTRFVAASVCVCVCVCVDVCVFVVCI